MPLFPHLFQHTTAKAPFLWAPGIIQAILIYAHASGVFEPDTAEHYLKRHKDTFSVSGRNDWNKKRGGYGVDAIVDGVLISTAFDVVYDWKDHIRYAFMSDFAKEDESDSGDVSWLIKAHFNVVQFYDWMFKHESLIPPVPEYTDPLGRVLSFSTGLHKVEEGRAGGIAPMAYGAIYAASRSFWEEHREWGLYCKNGQPMSFGGWLQFMDISKGSSWRRHILSEFCGVTQKTGFMGIHMDTYGFPKDAYNVDGVPVDLAAEFSTLIHDVKECLKSVNLNTGVIFNCVGNWPVEAVAKSPVDAVYIEVWPPYERYSHLVSLVRKGLIIGQRKPVILAAYMSAFKTAHTPDEISAAENALLLAYSVIHASGGTQLVLGENACVLCDPYYAEHKPLRLGFQAELQKYLDHVVRMSELLDMRLVEDISAEFTGGINTEFQFTGATCSPFPEVNADWTVIGRANNKYVIQLVNLTGLEHDFWNRFQKGPEIVNNLLIEALVDYEIKGIYASCPDYNDGRPQDISYTLKQTERGQAVCFTIVITE